MKLRKKGILIITGGAAVLVLLVFLLVSRRKTEETVFNTEKVSRGNIAITISSTGTVQALKTVEVGTQVSGVISRIYVDFNSVVRKGELMAELDKTPLKASLEDAQASLDDANAQVQYQKSNFERIQALYERKLAAQSDFDLATFNYSKALAGLKIAQARYDKAQVNLNYATIYSPIDGVVLNRAVDEGQTVAASFNTPTLFSIANDLTQMQVEADIDEADIGAIREGQHVEFTVDAYPEDRFTGEVSQIRLQPVTTSNVTTYTVIIRADNPQKKLMPGMTASLTVVIREASDVLLIPARALQYRHEPMALPQKDWSKTGYGNIGPEKFGKPGENKMTQAKLPDRQNVWVKTGDVVNHRSIKTGISDGFHTEVVDGLEEGEEVVVSATTGGKPKADSQVKGTSPFMPGPPRRR